MKPYGFINKILHNFRDNHIHIKRLVNWWENCKNINSKKERQKNKKNILTDMEN